MKTRILFLALVALVALVATSFARAEALDPAVQAKINAKVKEISSWAAESVIVDAVKAHNASVPADQAALTQEKWRALTVLDPLVRGFAKNPAGQFLKSKKDDVVTEAFISDAAGLKVAFVAKTSNWSHKGKEK